jgi:hypothetical protein
MSYILEKFGTTVLPQARPLTDVGAGDAMEALIPLPSGGAYDAMGSERARGRPIIVNHDCAIVGATTAAVQTKLDALKALQGTRNHLYRRMPDGTVQWITARLVTLTSQRRVENINYLDLSMTFSSSEYHWHGNHHGPGWDLDEGYRLDEGLVLDEAVGDVFVFPAADNVEVYNYGTYPVRNVIMTIDPGGVTITELTIIHARTEGSTSLKWTGSLVAGHTLVIDCGAFTVRNYSAPTTYVDAFTGLTRESGHSMAEWVILDAVYNNIALTRTGGDGSATITFDFSDGYA